MGIAPTVQYVCGVHACMCVSVCLRVRERAVLTGVSFLSLH